MLEINDFGPGTSEDKNTEEIAQIFFLLNQEHKELLSDEKILTEIHRRVRVFFDALEDSGGVYDVFEVAYKNTLYSLEKNKQQYLQGIAQGFISLLLFGNDEHKIEPNQDIDYINSRIEGLFRDISSPLADDIQNMLQYMIKKGYPQQNINRLGLMNEIKTPMSTIFDILDRIREQNLGNINNFDWTNVLFDLYLIKKKYLEITHTLYTKEDRPSYSGQNGNITYYERDKNLNLDVDLPVFEQLLIKAIDILPQLAKIHQDEVILSTYLMDIINNDTHDKEVDKKIGKLIKKHIGNNTISSKYTPIYRSYNENNPTYRDLNTKNFHTYYDHIVYFVDKIEFTSPLFGEIIDEYKKYKTIKTFDSYMGEPDFQQIEQDKQQFGAKCAYMDATKIFIEKLLKYQSTKHNYKLGIYHTSNVPQYEKIPTIYYDSRKSTGKLDMPYFKQLFQQRKAKNIQVIARSSAKNSEDNDICTGAGIYHSEIMNEKLTFKSFCNVIEKIYQSCESEHAVKYRGQRGIENESMGIVLQEYVYPSDCGQVNSIMQNRPELLEVVSGLNPRFRPIINKNELEALLYDYLDMDKDNLIFHYSPDYQRRGHDRVTMSKLVASTTLLLERYFGKPLQIEFVKGYCYNRNEDGITKEKEMYHIVQVRPLPRSRKEEKQVNFPQHENSIFAGRAIGVCDELLDILPTGDDNNEKIGAVVFADNKYASLNRNFVDRSLPKKGVVIVLQNNGANGHIETLCAEKGIVCLFSGGGSRTSKVLNSSMNVFNMLYMGRPTYPINQTITDLKGYKKIRVVANGLEGRVYGIDEPQTGQAK